MRSSAKLSEHRFHKRFIRYSRWTPQFSKFLPIGRKEALAFLKLYPFPVAVAVDPFPSEHAHNYRLRSYRTRSPIQQAVRGIVELSLSVPTIVTYKVEKNPLQADTSLAVSSTSIVPKILLRSKRPPNLQSF